MMITCLVQDAIKDWKASEVGLPSNHPPELINLSTNVGAEGNPRHICTTSYTITTHMAHGGFIAWWVHSRQVPLQDSIAFHINEAINTSILPMQCVLARIAVACSLICAQCRLEELALELAELHPLEEHQPHLPSR